jgi:predicted nucleic-acid-binding protein
VIAIDTNVLVRLLTADDPAQYKASSRLFATEQIFIPDTVVLETEWVLRDAYELEPAEIRATLRAVMGLPNVTLVNARRAALALDWTEQGLDFADAFHLVSSQEQEALKTYDKAFIKYAKGLSECRVERP